MCWIEKQKEKESRSDKIKKERDKEKGRKRESVYLGYRGIEVTVMGCCG